MGNLLRLLSSQENDTCCFGKAVSVKEIFVDFENSKPNKEEQELYNEADAILTEANNILNELKSYKGASKEIRDAITNPSPETELEAWNTVLPLVLKLKTFFEFSKKLEGMVPKILNALCDRKTANTLPRDGKVQSVGAERAAEQLDVHQAIVKQFAKLLDFVLKFDEAKMMSPALQNDFSYFRRTTQRLRNPTNNDNGVRSSITQDEVESSIPMNTANSMSLFFAHATPMLQVLSNATSKFVEENAGPVANSTEEMMGVMAKVCQKMLDTPKLRERIEQEETVQFILRVMVAIVILYDHVHPTGVFAKGSNVDVKGVMKVLRDQKQGSTDGLFNAVRYTTKHLNDESTPKSLKALILEEH